MGCEPRDLDVAEVRPVIGGAMRRRFGSVEVDVRDDGARLVGTVVAMPVDPVKLQLDRFTEDVVSIDVLAPFAVRIDRRTNQVVSDEVVLPTDAWPIVAGLRVVTPSGEAEVASTDGALVRVVEVGCLPPPNDPPASSAAPLIAVGVVAVSFAAIALFFGARGRRP